LAIYCSSTSLHEPVLHQLVFHQLVVHHILLHGPVLYQSVFHHDLHHYLRVIRLLLIKLFCGNLRFISVLFINLLFADVFSSTCSSSSYVYVAASSSDSSSSNYFSSACSSKFVLDQFVLHQLVVHHHHFPLGTHRVRLLEVLSPVPRAIFLEAQLENILGFPLEIPFQVVFEEHDQGIPQVSHAIVYPHNFLEKVDYLPKPLYRNGFSPFVIDAPHSISCFPFCQSFYSN
jgi:hypothetical protein